MKSALNAAIKLKSRLKEDPKPQDSGFRVLFCFLLFLLLKILFPVPYGPLQRLDHISHNPNLHLVAVIHSLHNLSLIHI